MSSMRMHQRQSQDGRGMINDAGVYNSQTKQGPSPVRNANWSDRVNPYN